MNTWVRIAALALVVFPSSLSASDCSKSCPGPAPEPDCDGMTIQIETNCSPTRCTITIKVNGNGGSDSTQEVEDPTSMTAFVLCVGSPPCCVTVFPCPDWAAAAASCAGSKVECQ